VDLDALTASDPSGEPGQSPTLRRRTDGNRRLQRGEDRRTWRTTSGRSLA
jgi:hypothetical protein